MTKTIHRLFDTLRERLSRGVWPPDQRVLVDAYVSLCVWREAGAHVFRVRNGVRAPALDADLALASAPVGREGQLYVLGRRDWVVLARARAMQGYHVSPGRSLGFRDPLLCYCMRDADERLMSGYINLREQPTPRHLRLLAGTATGELWSRVLEREEVAEEGVRLARVLPWFFGPGLTSGHSV